MLYILRLANGDCVVVAATDENSARATARNLSPDPCAEIVKVRRLNRFSVQLSPTEEGSLEVAQWDDATLDGILVNEYPLLDQAYRQANAEPVSRSPVKVTPAISHLQAWHQANTEIIREGLRRERARFVQPQDDASGAQQPKSKSARGRG